MCTHVQCKLLEISKGLQFRCFSVNFYILFQMWLLVHKMLSSVGIFAVQQLSNNEVEQCLKMIQYNTIHL